MEKKYQRYRSKYQISAENTPERKKFESKLISDFLEIYNDKEMLNIKIDNLLFSNITDEVGFTLQEYSRSIVNDSINNKEIHNLLDHHPVPKIVDEILTKEVRVFCLALNALKTWCAAEQAAMDRLLLGGQVHKKLQDNIVYCTVSKEKLIYKDSSKINYHHPMRDGRIPIPLSKKSHDELEGQTSKKSSKAGRSSKK